MWVRVSHGHNLQINKPQIRNHTFKNLAITDRQQINHNDLYRRNPVLGAEQRCDWRRYVMFPCVPLVGGSGGPPSEKC